MYAFYLGQRHHFSPSFPILSLSFLFVKPSSTQPKSELKKENDKLTKDLAWTHRERKEVRQKEKDKFKKAPGQ